MQPSRATEVIQVRSARDNERAAVRDVTLAAYEEYAQIMPAPFWTGYRHHLLSILEAATPADRIVAEQKRAVVGSVFLFPPGADAYGGTAAGGNWPEVRLLAVVPAARGRGIGAALMEECVRRARSAGAAALGLHTMDLMRAAVQMYARMGFVRVPERDVDIRGVLVKGYRLDLASAPDARGAR
ncbi:MAG TPA: GNAT family N-acetyltransferase [bacterium]|nr:GNAT family N-acetyltransferase [bacterium]